MTYFLGDANFFKQYHRAMAPMCCALDVIQGEEKAYMGSLLPTLAVAKAIRNIEKRWQFNDMLVLD